MNMLKLKEYQKVYQEIKRVKSMANASGPLPNLSPVGLRSQQWSRRGELFDIPNRRAPVLFANHFDPRFKKNSLHEF